MLVLVSESKNLTFSFAVELFAGLKSEGSSQVETVTLRSPKLIGGAACPPWCCAYAGLDSNIDDTSIAKNAPKRRNFDNDKLVLRRY